jgi:hopene-associated glycosyltransferase HpnB
MNALTAPLLLTILSIAIWLGLLIGRGQFWRSDQRLGSSIPPSAIPAPSAPGELPSVPTVAIIIPARNEAQVLPDSLPSLLCQYGPARVQIILVDDHSSDGTSTIACSIAEELDQTQRLTLLPGSPLPEGWTGKLWAMAQGVELAKRLTPAPDFLLFTDADIRHAPDNLSRLLAKAELEHLTMASLMVRLRCTDFWEKLMIPAFVFFFQKLYPFRWVNQPTNPTAAAAGGCILIRPEALSRIGGLEAIHRALIDDCALARAVKTSDRSSCGEGRIWIGLSEDTESLRAYTSLASIWEMVSRTAFTQLDHSPLRLFGTIVGMSMIYLIPPISALSGWLRHDGLLLGAGLIGWLLMAYAYAPTVRFYRISLGYSFLLPVIALLYTLMTFDSALQYWQGRGGAWKGRTYGA